MMKEVSYTLHCEYYNLEQPGSKEGSVVFNFFDGTDDTVKMHHDISDVDIFNYPFTDTTLGGNKLNADPMFVNDPGESMRPLWR